MKEKILVIAGPTASGKTALGVEMAQRLDGEIISADSMQIYKGMDIATAKPIKEEMRNIPHHLISFVDRNESFSVADYVIHAAAEAEKIISCGKMPIVVGGTGLYISSFVDNIRFPDIKSDEAIRKRLTDEAREYGNSVLLERLKSCDPEIAAELHENNLSRVIRALEVYEITGKKLKEGMVSVVDIASPSQIRAEISGVLFVFDKNSANLMFQSIDKNNGMEIK